MKRHLIQSFLLAFSLLLVVACGTDNKENPPEPDGPYSFFDATTPVKVTKPSEDENGTLTGGDYDLSVTLQEYNLAQVGEEITMRPFASVYGFVAELSVTTDSNGRATFFYTAPTGSDFDAVRGQDITIQAIYEDSEVVTTTTSSSAPDILLTQDFVLQFR